MRWAQGAQTRWAVSRLRWSSAARWAWELARRSLQAPARAPLRVRAQARRQKWTRQPRERAPMRQLELPQAQLQTRRPSPKLVMLAQPMAAACPKQPAQPPTRSRQPIAPRAVLGSVAQWQSTSIGTRAPKLAPI